MPSFCGGSADLWPSTKTYLKGWPDIAKDHFEGRNFHFGIREHGMGAICTGLAANGGLIPFASTFLIFSDYMRPTLRLASISICRYSTYSRTTVYFWARTAPLTSR